MFYLVLHLSLELLDRLLSLSLSSRSMTFLALTSFAGMDVKSPDNGDDVGLVEVELNKDKGILGIDVGVGEDELSTYESEIVKPKVGMKFDSIDEMYEFFRVYAKHMGFTVKKRSSKKDDDGIVRYLTFSCGRGRRQECMSSNVLKPQADVQAGCKFKLTASLDRDERWRVNVVVLDHNHEPSPSKSHYFGCNRQCSELVERNIKVNDNAEININQNCSSSVVKEAEDESMSIVETDCRNYVVGHLKLGEGDAVAIRDFLFKMQLQNTGSVCSMNLSEDGQLKNVFWADDRNRETYKEFGEVVTFDTTYLTNKYSVPLVLFVGVNHHGHSTLLGCGLVCSEDMEMFVWLFRTWLTCMFNCAPKGIITDQNKAIQNAIGVVFPNSRHRWCLWLVMKKLSEKLVGHEHYESISSALKGVIYDSKSPAEFEQSWSQLLDKYRLHENNWLSGLYNERCRWVPCFVKTSFWAGMSTTQQTESMNAFFHGNVNSKTTIKQFLEHYDDALRCKMEKESQSYAKMVPCVTTYEMEKQVQGVYTISKFKEFQSELMGKIYCHVISIREDGMVSEYDIREDMVVGEVKKVMIFSVSFKKDACEVKCSCHMFEHKGILCRHAIDVLFRNNVTLLPDKYILRRWRKDVMRDHTRVRINDDGGSFVTPKQLRYDELCREFSELASLAAEDEELYHRVMKWRKNQMTEVSSKRLKKSK